MKIKFPSRIYMLCCQAAQTKRPELINELLRSNEPLSDEDRAHIADFNEGKFNPRGTSKKYEEAYLLAQAAAAVRTRSTSQSLTHPRNYGRRLLRSSRTT
jgi:hypothetical protein